MGKVIIDAGGRFKEVRRKIEQSHHIGTGRKQMVLLKSLDPDAETQDWFLVKKGDAPKEIIEVGCMGVLENPGNLAQAPGEAWWYRAEPLIEFEETLRRTFAAQEYESSRQ